MSGGGGGQSGVTQYNWNDTMARYYQGYPEEPGGWLQRAATEAGKPYQGYQYNRIAGVDPMQQNAMALINHTVNGGGAPDTAAGREAARQFASGDKINPYGGMSNPYFQNVLNQGVEDITNAYQMGTAADTTRMFNNAGAFGGSAHQQAMANNQSGLLKQLGNYVSGMQNQQYDRSAGLASEDMARQLQSIPLAQSGQNLSFDAARNLMGAGDFGRSVNQQGLDDAYQRWAEQNNYGRNAIDWMFNVLGRAQGSTGTSINTPGYGGINPAAGLLGAASLYGAFK